MDCTLPLCWRSRWHSLSRDWIIINWSFDLSWMLSLIEELPIPIAGKSGGPSKAYSFTAKTTFSMISRNLYFISFLRRWALRYSRLHSSIPTPSCFWNTRFWPMTRKVRIWLGFYLFDSIRLRLKKCSRKFGPMIVWAIKIKFERQYKLCCKVLTVGLCVPNTAQGVAKGLKMLACSWISSVCIKGKIRKISLYSV